MRASCPFLFIADAAIGYSGRALLLKINVSLGPVWICKEVADRKHDDTPRLSP
jgi:hypothetical protein